MRKNIFKITLFVAFVTLAIASFGQSSTYIDAVRAYQSKAYDVAQELLLEEIQTNPNNDAAYYYLALIEKDLNPESLLVDKYFNKALELSPDNFWYKYFLAMHYADTGRAEVTTILMEELIEANPKNRSLYFELANLYLQQKDIEKALKTLDKIEGLTGKNEIISLTRLDLSISANPASEKDAYKTLEEDYKQIQTPMMATALADYHASMFEDSLALSFYNQALDMDDTYVPAYYGRAHVYQALRQYDNYFQDIQKFIKDKGTNPAVKGEYIQSITENPQIVRAFMEEIDTLMLELHTTHPADTSLNTLEGVYYYQTGREAFAIELFRQNTELYPESESLALQYLMILYYNQNWDVVVPIASEMLEKNPYQSDVRQLRAIGYTFIEKLPEAIKDYEFIRNSAPKDSSIIVMSNLALGDLYFQVSNFNESQKCFERVLRLDPNNIGALNNYAYYLSLEGKKLKKAKEMSQKTIKAEPDNPTYIDTYAWILHLLGQDVEAKAMFKHAMLYGGKESAVILDHYAEVLYDLKEYDLAFIYWDQAKNMDSTLGIEEKIAVKKATIK